MTKALACGGCLRTTKQSCSTSYRAVDADRLAALVETLEASTDIYVAVDTLLNPESLRQIAEQYERAIGKRPCPFSSSSPSSESNKPRPAAADPPKPDSASSTGQPPQTKVARILPDCPVCFGDVDAILGCGHVICTACSSTLPKDCPICRKRFAKVIRMYVTEKPLIVTTEKYIPKLGWPLYTHARFGFIRERLINPVELF